MTKMKISCEKINNIIIDFNDDLKIKEIAQKNNVCSTSVLKILYKKNLLLPKEKIGVDKTFFNEINSEEKAYWLGFISADGHVNDDEVSIQLSIKDINHLEKFKKDIFYLGKIRIRKQYNKYFKSTSNILVVFLTSNQIPYHNSIENCSIVNN